MIILDFPKTLSKRCPYIVNVVHRDIVVDLVSQIIADCIKCAKRLENAALNCTECPGKLKL